MPKNKDRETKEEKYVRPNWDDYFQQLAKMIGMRGTCDRGRSGCIIVKDRHILSTGYVGSPAGMPHCDEIGHQMKKTTHEDGSESWHCVRTIHSEQNAIVQAAKFGVSLDGAIIYTKFEPCAVCAKLIVNSGIKRVVAQRKYHASKETRAIFKQCGVTLKVIEKDVEKYDKQ